MILDEPDLIRQSFKRRFKISLRDSPTGLKIIGPHILRRSHGKELWEASREQLPADSQQENKTSVQQLEGCEFCHNCLSLEEDSKLQKRTQPGQLLLTSWAGPQAQPCLDWCMETCEIIDVCCFKPPSLRWSVHSNKHQCFIEVSIKTRMSNITITIIYQSK